MKCIRGTPHTLEKTSSGGKYLIFRRGTRTGDWKAEFHRRYALSGVIARVCKDLRRKKRDVYPMYH